MATGVAIAGLVVTVASQVSAGSKRKKAAKKQAGLLRQQAQLQEEAAAFEALQQDRAFEKLMGRQRLAIAASGVRLEGSSLQILEESLRDKKETIDIINKTGSAGAGALNAQGQALEKAGRNAFIGSIVGAVGTAAQGASQIGSSQIGGSR